MGVILGTLLAGSLHLAAPPAGTSAPPPSPPTPPTATQSSPDAPPPAPPRTTARTRRSNARPAATYAPADDPVERRRNRARYLHLVDLRDPFSPHGDAAYQRERRPEILPDLKDPFLLAARPRSAWRTLPALPGDIRDPFDARGTTTVCTTEPERARNGVALQRPRHLREQRARTKCVTTGAPAVIITPPDLRDPFPPGRQGNPRSSR